MTPADGAEGRLQTLLVRLARSPRARSVILAAVLFGVAAGTALSVVSATIAATICLLIGRRLGREQVEQIAGQRVTHSTTGSPATALRRCGMCVCSP